VLIAARFGPGIRDGSITLTFRRWKRRQVVAGRRYRTTVGQVDVDAIDEVGLDDITEADAVRAGYPSVDALVADLRGSPSDPIYRIELRAVHEPDPRDVLAADDALDDEARAEIDRRLDRLDSASARGPWTRETLRQIGAQPGVRAPDLAAEVGLETAPFKLDVRKLKALGLTTSLLVGYELSPRGRAYLAGRADG